jgi:hypothetical protein
MRKLRVLLPILAIVFSSCGTNPSDISTSDDSSSNNSNTSSSEGIFYTITWKNYDGTTLEIDSDITYGTMPTYDGAEPTKSRDAQYSYAFRGWDKEIVPVVSDTTYTAEYSTTTNKYLISFKNYDGTVLQSSKWEYGEMPIYSGSAPTKPGDAQYSAFNYVGWDKVVSNVVSNAIYTATFEGYGLKQYTVQFVNYNGDVLQTFEADYGSTTEYTGIIPTKPADAQYESYTFSGWLPSISIVTQDVAYQAQYTNGVAQKYTITFKNYDGTVLQSTKWTYGSYPLYSGSVPEKPDDILCTYDFSGWSPTINFVTEDAIYTACFDKENISKLELGKYPQTVVEDSTLLSALATASDTDGDGYLEYNGAEYYKLANATLADNSHDSFPQTSRTGNTSFVSGSSYYFKVEPIEWNVLDSESGLLVSKYILFSSDFYTSSSFLANRTIGGVSIAENNYKYSTLRAKLNGLDFISYTDSNDVPGVDFSSNVPGVFSLQGGFLNNAFSSTEQLQIVTTEVDNSPSTASSSSTEWACDNTNDKIFALSYQDMNNAEYGFNSSSFRKAIVSDFARATGTWFDNYVSEYWTTYGEGWYWTRSPATGQYYSGIVGTVNYLGSVSDLGVTDDEETGVRPALKIDIS